MSMTPSLIVHGDTLRRSLREFQKTTRRSVPSSLNLAGRLWASFAYKNTKQASPDDIRAYLMERVGAPKGKSKSQFNGTRAERIVIASLRKKGKLSSIKNRAALNQAIRKFVNVSVNSAGYHKAGWIPALRTFRARGRRSRGRGRFVQPIPGNAKKASRTETTPNGFLENFARQFTKMQPDVLGISEKQVARQMAIFMVQDIRAAAKKTGWR